MPASVASGQYPLGCIHIRTEKQNFVKNQSEVALVCAGSNQHSLIGSLNKILLFRIQCECILIFLFHIRSQFRAQEILTPKFDDRRQCNHAESSY